jgi:hypothetical protein
MDGADLAMLGEDLPVVGVILVTVGALVFAVAAVLFVVPALIFLLELLLIVVVVALGLIGRLLLRRPWTIEAIEAGSGDRYEWKVVGWRASGELLRSVANQLEATGLPTGGTKAHP